MATTDDVIVEVKDPSNPTTNIPLESLDEAGKSTDGPKSVLTTAPAAAKSFLSRTIGRLNPFGPKDEAAEKAKAEKKAAAEAEKKRKEEEESDDPGEIPEDKKGKMAWLRRVMRKWLPPPWNYLVAGSPTTAGLAFGGYWIWTKYIMADDDKKTE